MAVKSLIAFSRSRPSRRRVASMANDHAVWFVISAWSPTIGPAMAIAASGGRSAPVVRR